MVNYGASIQLTDKITPILNSIMNAMNMTISTVYDMQGAISKSPDLSSFDAVKNAIAEAEVAQQALIDEMNKPLPAPKAPEWSSDSFEVFTNTGVNRFVSESQAALNMMNQLAAKQSEIAANAANVDIFPPNAVSDITSIGNRMNAIRDKISRIESNPLNPLDPAAANELENLRQQLSSALDIQEQMNNAVNEMDISRANALYQQLNSIVNQTEQNLRDNVNAQGQFNSKMQEGIKHSSKLRNMVGGMVSAYAIIQGAQKTFNLSDEMTGYEARLSLLVDENSLDMVQNQIFAAAQDSRGVYTDMLGSVSRLGQLAGKAFTDATGNINMNEVIRFQELMNKNFVVGGASATEQASAMYQLTQAMGSGRLQGDEYRSIIENAPLLAQSIEDYMTNVQGAEGTMKEWAAEGLLTADVIKNAVFSSADEIEEKFNQMPMSWAQVGTAFKNDMMFIFDPILDKINELANNEDFQKFMVNLRSGFAVVGAIASGVVNTLANGAMFISRNWSIIAPIIYGVAAAVGFVAIAYGIFNAIQFIHNIQTLLESVQKYKAAKAALAHSAALTIEEKATHQATIAQHQATIAQAGFNTALLASPITWILVIIIAVIAAIFMVIAVIKKVTGTSTSALGMIVGAVYLAGAFIKNIFLGLVDVILGIINYWANKFISFANFIANVFRDPIGSIIHLFGDMADNVLGVIETIASAIDKVFGSSLADTVSGWRGTLNTKIEAAVSTYGNGAYEKVLDNLNLSSATFGWERSDLTDAFGKGAAKGDEWAKKMNSLTDKFNFDPGDTATIAMNTGDTAASADEISDQISASSEDELEYLRMIAERETVNRFTTAEIHLDFTSNATINNDLDLDGLINTFTTELGEVLVTTAEGLET